MNKLVLYFTVEYGNTKKVAEALQQKLNCDIFEIVPKEPYTKDDINWRKLTSRCNKEWLKKKDIETQGEIANLDSYDTIYVGFPIWYGCAPLVVSSFLKKHNLKGKNIYVFATSGGSQLGKTVQKLEPFVEGAKIVDAKLTQTEQEIIDWIK